MICTTCDKGRPVLCKGMCRNCYMRDYRNGTTDYTRWYQEIPTYSAMHKRLMRAFGPASEQKCFDCGEEAQHWSCSTEDRVEGSHMGSKVTYSIRIEDYSPRCVPCHKAYDLEVLNV